MAPTCFDAVDRHVVAGAADRVALSGTGQDRRPVRWTYARLLEEVAAFGGVLRHCGVSAGDPVWVTLPESPEAVVAVLACARIGAEHRLVPDPRDGRPGVWVAAASQSGVAAVLDAAERAPTVVLVKQQPGAAWPLREGRDYDWDVVMRAGRTDPAAWVPDAEIAPYDEPTRRWVEPLLAGETLHLG